VSDDCSTNTAAYSPVVALVVSIALFLQKSEQILSMLPVRKLKLTSSLLFI